MRITAQGLPHSEGTGSQPDCGSPVVSLLVYVLRRLIVPRHPPTAHHVLPGHGSLGARGILPHDASTRYRNTHRTHRHCAVRITINKKRRIMLLINRKNMYLVRYGCSESKPCPLTCASCVFPLAFGGKSQRCGKLISSHPCLPPGCLCGMMIARKQ